MHDLWKIVLLSKFYLLRLYAFRLPNRWPWDNLPYDQGPFFGIHWSLNISNVSTTALNTNFITYASTTLEVPPPGEVKSEKGALGLFPALTDHYGDIVQSIVATYTPEANVGYNS